MGETEPVARSAKDASIARIGGNLPRVPAPALGRRLPQRTALARRAAGVGYQGTYKAVGKIVFPWRQGNVDFERTANDVTIPAPPPPVLTDPTQRQISPHIAATLLTISRPDLTPGNAQIVDALKVGCPSYAVMRSLMMGFRALLKQFPPTPGTTAPPRTVSALHR